MTDKPKLAKAIAEAIVKKNGDSEGQKSASAQDARDKEMGGELLAAFQAGDPAALARKIRAFMKASSAA